MIPPGRFTTCFPAANKNPPQQLPFSKTASSSVLAKRYEWMRNAEGGGARFIETCFFATWAEWMRKKFTPENSFDQFPYIYIITHMKNILYPNIISLSDSPGNLCWHPARQRVTVQRRIGFSVGGPSSKVPGPRRPKKKVSRGKCACIELDGEIQVKISDSSDSMLHGFIEKNNHVLKCSTTFHVCCFGVKTWEVAHFPWCAAYHHRTFVFDLQWHVCKDLAR